MKKNQLRESQNGKEIKGLYQEILNIIHNCNINSEYNRQKTVQKSLLYFFEKKQSKSYLFIF